MSYSPLNAMIPKDVEDRLLALSPEGKMKAMRLLALRLGVNWASIEKSPGICGGDACVAKTRIPVRALVQARQQGSSDAEILGNYPVLSAGDLASAWLYEAAHPEEVEQAIEANEAT